MLDVKTSIRNARSRNKHQKCTISKQASDTMDIEAASALIDLEASISNAECRRATPNLETENCIESKSISPNRPIDPNRYRCLTIPYFRRSEQRDQHNKTKQRDDINTRSAQRDQLDEINSVAQSGPVQKSSIGNAGSRSKNQKCWISKQAS